MYGHGHPPAEPRTETPDPPWPQKSPMRAEMTVWQIGDQGQSICCRDLLCPPSTSTSVTHVLYSKYLRHRYC